MSIKPVFFLTLVFLTPHLSFGQQQENTLLSLQSFVLSGLFLFLTGFFICLLLFKNNFFQKKKPPVNKNNLFTHNLFSEIFDNIPLGIQIFDRHGFSYQFNPYFQKLLGLPDKNHGIGVFNVLSDPFSKANGMSDLFARSYNGETILDQLSEIPLETPTNNFLTATKTLFLNQTILPLKDENGQVVFVIALIEDISEQKRHEILLTQSEQFFRAIFEQASMGIIQTQLNGAFDTANQFFCDLTGYNKEELLKLNIRDLIHQDGENLLSFPPIASPNQTLEIRIILKNKQIIWVKLNLSYLRDKIGNPYLLLGLIENINQRKELEEKLRIYHDEIHSKMLDNTKNLLQSEVRFKLLFKAIPLAGYIWEKEDDDFRLTDFNDKAYDFTQGEIAKLLNIKFSQFFQSHPSHIQDMNECWHTKKTITREYWHTLITTGEKKYLQVKYAYVPDYYILVLTEDMTLNKQTENNLQQAKIQAEESNQAKSFFLSNISHEIRTPLNAIIGYSELLSGKLLEPKDTDYLRAIRNSGKSLLNLINDILDLSKIEANKLNINLTPVNIRHFINEIINIFQHNAAKKNLLFTFQIDEDLPDNLLLDETRMRQILFNLMGNALKFTEKGFITLKTTCTPAQKNQSDKINLHFVLEDSGIGIKKEFQPHIFGNFNQQDPDIAVKYGGTGLGLSITQKLVLLLGGQISFSSQEAIGTTFKVDFPDIIRLDNIMSSLNPVQEKFQDIAILIIDDDLNNRNILKEMLLLINPDFAVYLCDNFKKVMEMYQRIKPNLIFLDINLGNLKGIDIFFEFQQKGLLQHCKIFALTTTDLLPFEQSILTQFHAYLKKPFSYDQLKKPLRVFFLPAEKNETDASMSNHTSFNDKLIPAANQNEIKLLLVQAKNTKYSEDILKLAHYLKSNFSKSYPELFQKGENLENFVENFQFDEIKQALFNLEKIFKDDKS